MRHRKRRKAGWGTHPCSQSSSSFSSASFINASTSSSERLKFSIENAYALTHWIFKRRQTSNICSLLVSLGSSVKKQGTLTRRKATNPSACPSATCFCCLLAYLRFPSITKATCLGTGPAARTLRRNRSAWLAIESRIQARPRMAAIEKYLSWEVFAWLLPPVLGKSTG